MSDKLPESDARFDVIYKGDSCTIDYHFCRTWDGDRGCHGTNPDHGCSFDEAKVEVAKWHRQQAERWERMAYAEWHQP